MSAIPEWSGRRVQQARAHVARSLPAPCGQCGHQVQPDPPGTLPGKSGWVVGHTLSRTLRPDLTWVPSNWRPEHRACSDSSGQAAVIEKARAVGYAAAMADTNNQGADAAPSAVSRPQRGREPDGGASSSSLAHTREQTPPLPPSLSPQDPQERVQAREVLTWTYFIQTAPTWTWEHLGAMVDAAPPLAMTPTHPDAVGSYGGLAIRWIEEQFGRRLRWWQRLVLVRILEHRADGTLCWRFPIVSASRRAGKSLLVRGLICWRLAHADLIGEVQTAVHTGSDLNVCRETQRTAWTWAEGVGWRVFKSNGKEALEASDGSRWLTRAQDAIYSVESGLGVADECWDVQPSTISDGLEPAGLERLWPQLLLTSTAHPKATSLMPRRISSALAQEDGKTLLILWAAPADADPGDPQAWRDASPHWSDDRAEMMAAKYAAALAGEQDPEFDDLSPMESFTSQYLNVWRLRSVRSKQTKGDAVISTESWQALETSALSSWRAYAIEATRDGVSLARASWDGDRVTVSATGHPTLAAAMATVPAAVRSLAVGASLADDPALAGRKVQPMTGRAAQAVSSLLDLVREDALRHDGSEHLADQVLAARTATGPDGLRVLPGTRTDAIKATLWAVLQARKPGPGKVRIVLPSNLRGGART